MSLILCIETATTNCSVALGKDGTILALKEDYNTSYSHAERLHIYIQEILKENGLNPDDLDAVAVSQGPGSYTGLRIGVAAAKGLCFSLDIPLLSISTLTSLAYQVSSEESVFIFPLLDARRMEVYTAGFTAEKKEVAKAEAKILEEDSFNVFLQKGKVTFIGDGADKFQKICKHRNAQFRGSSLPSAKEMVSLAQLKFQEEDFEDVAYFEPFYLKDFMAG